MADISRMQQPVSQSSGWSEVNQALDTLRQVPGQDKHLRTIPGQTELHVHDSSKLHGLGSPKAKYKAAVELIKAAIDKDYGAGSGDKVFRQIGIKHDSQGIKLKQIDALQQAVANLPQPIDQTTAKEALDLVNRPTRGPVDLTMKDGTTVTISGQMLRDLLSGFSMDIGGNGPLRYVEPKNEPPEVVEVAKKAVVDTQLERLHEITRGDSGHMLALSKALSQQCAQTIMDAEKTLGYLVLDSAKGEPKFELDRTSTGYSLTVDYHVPVKANTAGGDLEMYDPNSSKLTVQATIDIPFGAIHNDGNIDWSRIDFDPQAPPRYVLDVTPA